MPVRSRGANFWGAWIGVAIAALVMWPLLRDLIKASPLPTLLHLATLLVCVGIFCIRVWRKPSLSGLNLLWPLLAAVVLHVVIAIQYQPHIVDAVLGRSTRYRARHIMPFSFFLLFTYMPLILVGKSMMLMWIQSSRRRHLDEAGVPAMARITSARDLGARMREGVRKSYLVELTLVVEGLPQSPYEVTGSFVVSEYYIHRLTSSADPVPVKVDPDDPTRVSLDLSALD